MVHEGRWSGANAVMAQQQCWIDIVVVRKEAERRENVLNAWGYPTESFNFGYFRQMNNCLLTKVDQADHCSTTVWILCKFCMTICWLNPIIWQCYCWIYGTCNLTDFSRDGDGPGMCSCRWSHPNHGSSHWGRFPGFDHLSPSATFAGVFVWIWCCHFLPLSKRSRSGLCANSLSFFILFLGNQPSSQSLGTSTGSWMRWPQSGLVPLIHDGGLSLLKPTQPPSSSPLVWPLSFSSSLPAS